MPSAFSGLRASLVQRPKAVRSGFTLFDRRCSRPLSLVLKRNFAINRRPPFRQESFNRGPRVNEQIRRSPIRLIDENEEMIGVISVNDALERARTAGLDLVEVSPDADPPVCRILEFGKYKYELSKKEKANKAKSKSMEPKEVRLGRSMKIDPHDIQIRLNQARRFLLEGHKVQIVQNFRGREMMHQQRGMERMNHIIALLADISKVEMDPRQNGRRMTMMLAPDKAKIDAVRKKDEKALSQPHQYDVKRIADLQQSFARDQAEGILGDEADA